MSYAHHLFIEQSMNYTKDGGYLFFLAPSHLFESEQSKQLHKYIQNMRGFKRLFNYLTRCLQINH